MILDDKVSSDQKIQDVIEACSNMLENGNMSDSLLAELLYNRAKAQSKIGNIRDAVSDCIKGLKLKPLHISLLMLRAECLQNLEDFKKSIEDYMTVLRIESVSMNVVETVRITSKIDENKIALRHKQADEHKNTGDVEYARRKFNLALLSYDAAIKLWPENVYIHKQRIACYLNLTDYKGAVQACHSALLIDAHSSEIYEIKFETHLLLGDVHNAAKTIRKYAETETQKDDVNKHERNLLKLKQAIENAEHDYKKCDFVSARKLNLVSLFVNEVSNIAGCTICRFNFSVASIGVALTIARASYDLLILKGECLALLGRIDVKLIPARCCFEFYLPTK